jgi:hypothetical protein
MIVRVMSLILTKGPGCRQQYTQQQGKQRHAEGAHWNARIIAHAHPFVVGDAQRVAAIV